MCGTKLHEFDLSLCYHGLCVICGHMDDAAFADYVRPRLDPSILRYLSRVEEQKPTLLLCDRDLNDLYQIFYCAPFQFDRAWIPYRPLYKRSTHCLPEIREALAAECAEEWARVSAANSRRLSDEDLNLSGGFEILAEWVGAARDLIQAMGRRDLIPIPDGTFPTPAYPEAGEGDPTAKAGIGRSFVDVMRRIAAALEAQREQTLSVPEALSRDDAARVLGVDRETIDYLIRTRRLEYVQVGSQRGRIVPLSSIRKFITDNRKMPANELIQKRKR
jgi:excisionase family DNA binding protein